MIKLYNYPLFNSKFLLLAIITIILVDSFVQALPQSGTQDAAASLTRHFAETGIIPMPDEVAVEELVNGYIEAI
ncbi:MAG: hypothetical protein AB1489_05860 [Acidobacteriota bacterium]